MQRVGGEWIDGGLVCPSNIMLSDRRRQPSRVGGGSSLPQEDAAVKELLALQDLSYRCGGSDVGGPEASRLLSGSFVGLDATVITLTGQYRDAERVVLYRAEQVVAAAVVHVHAEPSLRLLDVPIFAAVSSSRRQGLGSVLAALLVSLSRVAIPIPLDSAGGQLRIAGQICRSQTM